MQIFKQRSNHFSYLLINVFSYCVIWSGVAADSVEIKGPDSMIIGETANFTGILYSDGKIAPVAQYRFIWKDDANPLHYGEFTSSKPINTWSINYPKNTTEYRKYRINLTVEKYILFYWSYVTSNNVMLEVTDTLAGKIQLVQDRTVRKNQYVSTNTIVDHAIDLPEAEKNYVIENSSYIRTYWFQNCTYLGYTDGLSYLASYEVPEQVYEIEALVVVSFKKLPDPVTTTTTTTTTTITTPRTTSTSTSTTTTTTTTPKPITPTPDASTIDAATVKPAIKTKRDTSAAKKEILQAAQTNAALLGLNLTTLEQQNGNKNASSLNVSSALVNRKLSEDVKHYNLLPPSATTFYNQTFFDCIKKSVVARDPMKLYGYYKTLVVSKSPISNFSTSGKNWLQHGDLLDLKVKCQGSTQIKCCDLVFKAPYNATGNETCNYYYDVDKCEFSYSRYFSESKTILFFIRNDVSETVNQVTINIYEAKKTSQLTLVVVPVIFSLIAIILIVFGVSYYLQSRNRFNVEVADFNFGETQSVDFEYKTFHQRLIDSVRTYCLTRLQFPRFSSEPGPEPDSPTVSTDSNLPYNTMN